MDEAAQRSLHRGEGFHFAFDIGNLGFGASANIRPVFVPALPAAPAVLPPLQGKSPTLERI